VRAERLTLQNSKNTQTASFIEEICGSDRLRVETNYGGGFVKLKISEAEKRQAAQDIRSSEDIIIELLRNSRDANAKNIYIATSKEGSKRVFVVIDDGCGIPNTMHQTVFEPRVTSKLDSGYIDRWGFHGRGMALYSIAINSEISEVVNSMSGSGCSIRVISNLSNISEKTDQSTFPTATIENNTLILKGPKNILRTVAEFSLECRNQLNVYIGSATEIAATIYANSISQTTPVQRAFEADSLNMHICNKFALADNPSMFAKIAHSVGLDISERSARRILNGEISQLKCVFDQLATQLSSLNKQTYLPKQKANKSNLSNHLSISQEDKDLFLNSIKSAYSELASSYYLKKDITPELKISNDEIRISFNISNVD
jgi:hypothetical protein